MYNLKSYTRDTIIMIKVKDISNTSQSFLASLCFVFIFLSDKTFILNSPWDCHCIEGSPEFSVAITEHRASQILWASLQNGLAFLSVSDCGLLTLKSKRLSHLVLFDCPKRPALMKSVIFSIPPFIMWK